MIPQHVEEQVYNTKLTGNAHYCIKSCALFGASKSKPSAHLGNISGTYDCFE